MLQQGAQEERLSYWCGTIGYSSQVASLMHGSAALQAQQQV